MLKVGILGGGQLGRMLLQAAANYPVITYVLENDDQCPAAHLCHHFTKGDIRNYDHVYQFGKTLDAITIEIESVNLEALEQLEKEGVRIYPKPAALRIIKNKIEQKQFYLQYQIPTASFVVTHNKEELMRQSSFLPAAHKLGMGGYDGRGVELLRSEADLEKGFSEPSVLEKMVDVAKEISMLVAVSDSGDTTMYPPAEMVFDNRLNQLDYQISPAELSEKVFWKAEAIAMAVVRNLQSPGLFAVELFVDKNGDVLVNETAPRVHNSGHHTIEGNYSSQFDMVWRIILNYPLGCTDPILPAVIVNIVGADGYNGPVVYEGLDEILKMENAFVHLYGKAQTKPGRKMGHVTVIGKDRQELVFKANRIKQLLKAVSR
ncbi:MAG: 5-(carboxyamino)imidazole ribonucleotide synthase [Chitinophagaceae bacterium]